MPMMKDLPEQIVTLLRRVEVETANGKTTPQVCKKQRSRCGHDHHHIPRQIPLCQQQRLSVSRPRKINDSP